MRASNDPARPSPARILVLFALNREAAPFRRLAPRHPECDIIVMGMGSRNAQLAIDTALTGSSPEAVLTCGFAGALKPSLAWGTVVIDADPQSPWATLPDGADIVHGRFLMVDRIIATAAEKTRLWQATGADAVEMESEVIRQACQRRGIPSATVRVISDTADEDLPLDFNRLVTPELRLSVPRTAQALAIMPNRWPALWRFQRRLSSCAQRLADVLALMLRRPSH